MVYEINEIVSKIGEIPIEGNIIPNEWYVHLRNDKGKIQTNAALILADIVYWYRPIPIYDIKTSQLIGYGKKFKDDLLQLNYKYFTNKFGFSENQTRHALIFLEEKQLITREFRDIVVSGHFLNNVMYIGISFEKILEISKQSKHVSNTSVNHTFHSHFPLVKENPKIAHSLPTQKISLEKDWSTKFTAEQKTFLDYLLNIKPEVGDPIETRHATWWIKHFGIEKIKLALQVYWQRVEKAKQDSSIPMPQHIGKYVRKALNDGILPTQCSDSIEKAQKQLFLSPYLEKSEQVVGKSEIGSTKNLTTNTQISMISLSLDEVNDSAESVTFLEKEEKVLSNEEPIKAKKDKAKTESINSKSFRYHDSIQKEFKKNKQTSDWKSSFTSDEKKFLAFLLSIIPAKGDPIEEKHATWWIKSFGIDKIKIALQVYWQQVEKAKKDSKVPMPGSIGAYVRDALNREIQPCRETDQRNKAFAEQFKRQARWNGLTITEKYCRAEEFGKEWHYNLPEALFQESLKSTFENYCCYVERQGYVA